MKALLLSLGCLLATPLVAHADSAKPEETTPIKDARLVPVMTNGVFVGLKVYAIRAGGRFDQPQARFAYGDTIELVDGVAVTTDAGSVALHDKVILGKADAVVTVRRQAQLVKLASKALP
ncbi:MAG: hypothetical protein H0T79_01800 [Deltaproteobacteria bacterium]|nr:hypothetical protein [Deltaproteobacteria bacterium]